MRDLLTVGEAAELVGRSRQTIWRWVTEGWLPVAHRGPHRNSPILIYRHHLLRQLPQIEEEMAAHKGGRGRRAYDAKGEPSKRQYRTAEEKRRREEEQGDS